jgi:hypothetical protein
MHSPEEECDTAALEAFKRIVPNLLATKKDWTNEEARLNTMIGVNRVTIMLKKGVLGAGASHGSKSKDYTAIGKIVLT